MGAACTSAGLTQPRETAAEAQASCMLRMKQGESALSVSDTVDVPMRCRGAVREQSGSTPWSEIWVGRLDS